jgi:hypothetical protein
MLSGLVSPEVSGEVEIGELKASKEKKKKKRERNCQQRDPERGEVGKAKRQKKDKETKQHLPPVAGELQMDGVVGEPHTPGWPFGVVGERKDAPGINNDAGEAV